MKVYGKWRYSSTILSGQPHASAALPPVPIVQAAVWAPEPVWTLRRRGKFLASAETRIPSSRRYTDRLSCPDSCFGEGLNFNII
jgi:hypothetical protein